MAYDEGLAERIREYFRSKKVRPLEKKMFGGLGFIVDDKMCIGVHDDHATVRIDPEATDEALKKKGVTVMVMRGKRMDGWMFVSTDVLASNTGFRYWLDTALAYNKEAKASKPMKKKSETKKAPTKKVVKKATPKKKR